MKHKQEKKRPSAHCGTTFMWPFICIIGALRKERVTGKVLKDIMAKVLPNLINTINPQILEAQKNSSTIVLIKSTPMHVIIHLLIIGDQKENLKAPEKQRHITNIETKIRMATDLLSETVQVGRLWSNFSKVLREKILSV